MDSSSVPITSQASETVSPSPVVKSITPKKPKIKIQPKPGYKFVKVPFPDGVIRTVERPLTEADIAAREAKKAGQTSTSTSKPTTVLPTTSTAAPQLKVKAQITGPAVTPATAKDATYVETPKKDASVKVLESKSVDSKPSSTPPTERKTEDKSVNDDSEAALDEQVQRNRSKRLSRFKTSLIRGAATVFAAAVPNVGVEAWNHDDVPIDDGVSDLSDDDFDDDYQHHEDNTTDSHHDESHTTTQIQTGAAAQVAATMATAKSAEKEEKKEDLSNKLNGEKKGPTEKVTYIKNAKDLEAAEKAAEHKQKPLGRHWSDVTFYFLAALSVILPVLLLSKLISPMKTLTNCNSTRNLHYSHER
jgi:hypothetical protein